MLFRSHGYQAIALAGVFATIFLSGTAPSFAAFKQIRDVWVRCDFAQNCTLMLNPTAGEGAPGLGIFRGSDAGSKPMLRLSYIDPSKTSGTLAVSIDGTPLLSVDMAALKLRDGQFDYRDMPQLTKLIDAMKNGRKLELEFGGKPFTYSLSGFVGGLIYLDEQQSRAGTVDALQARGDKAAPSPPEVRLIDSVEQIPAEIRKDFSEEAAICGGASASSFRNAGGFETRIGDGLDLIGLPCGSPGAYNQPYTFYSRYENRIVPISLPTLADDGPTVTDTAWNIDWIQKTKTLTAFFKGRGLGDCGKYDVWKATDNGEGRVRFVLVEERAKGDCDGNYAGGPEKWPTNWPIKPK
ncbi:DUF1176 domain-containing protein [Ochrobactrum sp. CM-21-5]|nr:DUF1176 domain-containing protein [Ochrobactrum sp. CM-21-5]MBC2886008.1 DUF1176 domain-containing protein [Ochrobactrum sp. CM-21-5]